MKTNAKISLGLVAVGAAAMVIYLFRRLDRDRVLAKVSDEGYETAHDILFPNKKNGGKALRYGPVLPM